MVRRRTRKLRFHIFAKEAGNPWWRYEGSVDSREAVPAQLESCPLSRCVVKVIPSREEPEVVLGRLHTADLQTPHGW